MTVALLFISILMLLLTIVSVRAMIVMNDKLDIIQKEYVEFMKKVRRPPIE
jgi:hypothetical protein